jgi:asparagine synthase (glutamine-hydrolysing)
MQFLAVRDPDASRRARALQAVRDRWSGDFDHVVSEATLGDVALLVGHHPGTPLSLNQATDALALLAGLAFEDAGGQGSAHHALDASRLAGLWRTVSEGAVPLPLEGYHLGIVASNTGRLVIGADLLGIGPVYWWEAGDCFAAASSPESIAQHPAFVRKLSRSGLAGILLTQHLLEGEVLLEGIRRLDAGHLLVSTPRQPAREIRQYAVPFSEDAYDLPFSVQTDMLGEAMARATARQLPATDDLYVLLSGGLDSRTVAGFVAEEGKRPGALTFGRPGEVEMRCAQSVTRHLGWRHETYEVKLDHHVEHALKHARWTHLSGGFNSIEYWQTGPTMRRMGAYFATGMVMDPIIGGTHITWGLDKATRRVGFDALLRYGNRYAVPQQRLHELVADTELRAQLQAAPDRMRRGFDACAPRDFQRVWLTDLMHRQRFHTGTFLWLLSFGSCPVMPATDSGVLRLVAGLPAASLAERRMQVEMVKNRFVHLAELPLDRNSHNDMPLAPSLRDQVERRLRAKAARHLPFLRPDRGEETRYYFNLYDFNGPGWKAVRAEAEGCWKYLDGLFDLKRLREYVPAPDANLQVDDGIVDTSGRKLLIGLALWAREHL